MFFLFLRLSRGGPTKTTRDLDRRDDLWERWPQLRRGRIWRGRPPPMLLQRVASPTHKVSGCFHFITNRLRKQNQNIFCEEVWRSCGAQRSWRNLRSDTIISERICITGYFQFQYWVKVQFCAHFWRCTNVCLNPKLKVNKIPRDFQEIAPHAFFSIFKWIFISAIFLRDEHK